MRRQVWAGAQLWAGPSDPEAGHSHLAAGSLGTDVRSSVLSLGKVAVEKHYHSAS